MLLVRTYVVSQDWKVIMGVFGAALFVFNLFLVIFMTLDSGTIPRLSGVVEQALATTLFFPFVLNMMDRFVSSEVRFQ
jgi:rod shape-determining protein MreD